MLKRYSLASSQHAAGDYITALVDTTIGVLAVISDYGNYAYQWTHPGREFRAFLADLDADYLCKKLTHGRRDAKVFDEEATKKVLGEALDEAEKESWNNLGVGWRDYATEVERLKNFRMPDEVSYLAWQSETMLTQSEGYAQYVPNPDAWNFCTKVWPRFAALLKQELKKEVADLKALQEARPGIKAAVQAEIADLTKEKG